MKVYDVIIVGAGIAGLGAAYEAHKRGYSYLVLEAQDRVGGRMHSQKLKNGLVVELGAEWVSRTDTGLLALCREFDLKLEKHTYHYPRFIYKNGKEFPMFTDLITRCEKVIKKSAGKNMRDRTSWYEFLKRHFNDEEMRKLNIIFSPNFAGHIRYVSAKMALSDISSGGNNDHADYHVVGGNSRVTEALSKAISRKKIKLSTIVTQVEKKDDICIIKTKDGATYAAKNLLFTVGAQAFKAIDIAPKMSKHKDAARNLKYGDITKLFLSFNAPLPREHQNFAMFTDGPFQYVYVCTQGQSMNKFTLCIYSVEKHARQIAAMDKHVLWHKLKQLLPSDAFDVGRMEPHEIIFKHWGQDRFTHGAYAVFQPHEHDRIVQTFLSKSENIFFAGEYLGPGGMFGYMNGALESGISAIKRMHI